MGKIVDNDNKQLPGKLKNPFNGQDKNEDNKNRIIPGKKNPFDGQYNKDGDRNRNISRKLKNKFGEENKKSQN